MRLRRGRGWWTINLRIRKLPARGRGGLKKFKKPTGKKSSLRVTGWKPLPIIRARRTASNDTAAAIGPSARCSGFVYIIVIIVRKPATDHVLSRLLPYRRGESFDCSAGGATTRGYSAAAASAWTAKGYGGGPGPGVRFHNRRRAAEPVVSMYAQSPCPGRACCCRCRCCCRAPPVRAPPPRPL